MSSKSAREELRRGLWPDNTERPEVPGGPSPELTIVLFLITAVALISSVVALSLVTP